MSLACPQCGLVLSLRGPLVEYCPRCIARRRGAVAMVSSALPFAPESSRRPRSVKRARALPPIVPAVPKRAGAR